MKKKRKAVVVDLDGTLFKDEFKNLIPEVITEKTWQEFHKKVNYYKDVTVNEDIAIICKGFLEKGIKIFFLTAREEDGLIKHNTKMAIDSVLSEYHAKYELVMRDMEDRRTAQEMKKERMKEYIMKNCEILLAIDDCKKNIEMFKSLKIPTMLYSGKN